MKNMLVLCTGNSARSILCEALLNRLGAGRVKAFSAGSDPKNSPHPAALLLLEAEGYETDAFSSKKWDVFAGEDAPKMDVVITVCDNAAGEACPIWPGAPVSAHWGVADPAVVEGEGQAGAFLAAYRQLGERVEALLALPFEDMAPAQLKAALNEIGAQSDGATGMALEKGMGNG